MAETATAGGKTPGDADAANASNPEQVTQAAPTKPAEGAVIAKEQEKAAKKDGDRVVTLDRAILASDPGLKYDDTGRLVTKDGKPVALSADATDADVGWTVQHAGAHQDKKDRRAYPGGPSGTPDQTVHPDELPDPAAALRAGLLPQNVGVLNVDKDKFKGKKPLEA